MTLAALIFDVDGTLAETEEVHRESFNHAFAENGLDWHWDRPVYRDLLKVAGGRERLRAFAPNTSDAQVAALHAAKTAHYTRLVTEGALSFRPGIEPLIEQARAEGLKLALGTTTSRANIVALLGGRCDWFDVIVCGEDTPKKKPDPSVYVMVLERLGLPAQKCLVIEDSSHGVQAARGAGLDVVVTESVYTGGDDFTGALVVYPDLGSVDLDRLRRLRG
ncbi:HAD-IA family hydrolase [Magnetospirillum molischianum]|uniref:Protein CbbY n=1 Tax=Magnetospirillum molischianum DSM 120 TaxID=1150626 RepID=H8FQR5_MAGML|nr:HAD-IA family hydrolase [Magnetospirillum molischianum]CCG40703.1 Protein CbbY [Magnetospirillum molischianum DSM 120]